MLNVDVEEMPTGEFSIAGGYSTASGWMAELSVAERNLLGQGQYARFAVQYGQYARGFELSFAEPFFLGYRLGVGVDLYCQADAGDELHFLQQPDRRHRHCAPASR